MSFALQKWQRKESEQRIINSLFEGDKSFMDLLELTGLSKPVLSRRLKSLAKVHKVKNVPDLETKKFLYRLNKEQLNDTEKIHLLLSMLSKKALEVLREAADSSISDAEYLSLLERVFSALSHFRTLIYLMTSLPGKEEWLRTIFGSEFVNMMPYIFPEKRKKAVENMIETSFPDEAPLFFTTDLKDAEDKISEYVVQKFKAIKSS